MDPRRVRRRDSGFPKNRDTPLRPTVGRRDNNRRLLLRKHHEAFPEEPDVNEMSNSTVKPNCLQTITVPVHCKSMSRLNNPAFIRKPRTRAASPATPVTKTCGYPVLQMRHRAIQVALDPEDFNDGDIQDKQTSPVTLESITSSSMEQDTTFDFGDEEEEGCFSSTASITSSTLPSPEIFRRESYADTLALPIEGDLLDLHSHVRNSTLLDASHAESIHVHHPPNLSTIIDASSILAEKDTENNRNHREHEAETKIQTDSIKTEVNKRKTPQTLTHRMHLVCKKKVCFKSPITDETFKANHIPPSKLSVHSNSESFPVASQPEKVKPDAETSGAGEISFKDESLPVTVRLRSAAKCDPEKAKFFDFVSDDERDTFFQKMRERWVKLRSAALFPLTVAKHI
ncbi:uncharacterized protein LOC125021679 isoform X2 [Mugil cephalus]|uniref:uncharacterized protein LOC125021679 isoform X2 n=1 Tax=Mugil cephalus TaxID=48193 RepID=UPI001FB57750|nr:uncharacterized protein LOC125021679 isoform X2 [Mugil cephalus]